MAAKGKRTSRSTRATKATKSKTTTRRATRDRKLVSDEPHEVEYLHRKFPNSTHNEVVRALSSCKKELNGSEDRRKVMACLRGKLKG